jgi:hypothetical protein
MDIHATTLVPIHSRRDPIEQLPRCTVRIKQRMKNYLVPTLGLVRQRTADADGWNTITIYERDLPVLQADVETDLAAIEVARQTNETDLAQWVSEKAGVTPEQIANPSMQIAERIQRAKNTYPGSVEACFFAMKKRGIKPLIALEVVEKNLPPPMTDDQRAQVSMLDAVKAALSPAQQSVDVAALMARLDEQAKQIATLTSKLSKKGGE